MNNHFMAQINTDYLAIAEEIKYYHNLILEEAKQDLRIKELYKGCQVFFSPLIYQPEFLLIGFNPGGGYYKWHGKIVEEFGPMQALEYYLNEHSLGEQTKSLFRMAGREDELQNSSVKINFYPWATENVAGFKELMQLLPKTLSSELFHLSRIWTSKIIDIVNPKTIYCEGFKAYDELEIIFQKKLKQVKTEIYKSFTTTEDLKVIGYKRNQGSIINKQLISTHIN